MTVSEENTTMKKLVARMIKAYRKVQELSQFNDTDTLAHCTRFWNIHRDLDQDAIVAKKTRDTEATISIRFNKAMRRCIKYIEGFTDNKTRERLLGLMHQQVEN